MKRKMLSILLVAALATSALTGCGKKSEEPATDTPSTTEQDEPTNEEQGEGPWIRQLPRRVSPWPPS